MAKRISPLRRLAACALAALLLIPALPPVTSQAANTNATTHYSYTTEKGNSTHSLSALPNNLIVGANRNRTEAMRINSGHLYLPEGREYIPSWSMFAYVSDDKSRDADTQGTAALREANHVGLPYRSFVFSSSSGTTYYKTATADLEIELAEMPALDTTGLGAVNLSILTAADPIAYGATGIDYDRQLQVYVSVDGTNWLSGYAGVRSSTLLGGGQIRYTQSTTTPVDGMFYRVETEDLLSSIDGLDAGDTIKKIKILPNGTDKRSTGWITVNNIDVNTWATAAAFTSAVPSDTTYTSISGDTLRSIVVAEAELTGSVKYKTTETIYTPKVEGGGSGQLGEEGVTTYAPGSYTGPLYKRAATHTREALQNAIVNGTYVGGTGTLAADGQTVEVDNAIGMDCQAFVYNAISRVSRSNAWSVAAALNASYSSIVAADKLTIADYPSFTDIDVVDKTNSSTKMYHNYANAKAGDVLVVYLANYSNSPHVRIVKSVNAVKSGSSYSGSSTITFIDQSSGSNRETYTKTAKFSELYNSHYVAVTLDEYAQGKVANTDLEMVVGSTKAGIPFQNGPANVAVSSNYRINDYQVTLTDQAGGVKFDSGKLMTPAYRTRAFNYQDAGLNAALADLDAGTYTLTVRANTGPYTSTAQLSSGSYHTVSQTFTKTAPAAHTSHSCDHGHAAFSGSWTPLSAVTDPATDHPILTGGNYYLDRDMDLGEQYIKIEGDVNLCLNGHTLTRTPAVPDAQNNCWIFKVKDTNDGLPVTFNLCDCSAEQTGAVGTGWTAKNTSATDAVAIVRKGGIFNFYGGKITGSTTRNTVYVAAGGTFNLKGGEISGNTTTANGVVNIISGGAFVAESGILAANETPDGKAQVTGLAGATFGDALIEDRHLHNCSHGHADLAEWGWTDLTRLVNEATSTVVLTEGYYYLSDDVDSSYQITVAGNVTLCLNGHTLSSSRTDGSYVFYFNADNITFDLCDCSAEQTGTVGPFISKKSSSTESAVIVRKTGTTFNLWSGTFTDIEAASVVYIAGGNTFNMYGGKITGNTTVSLESKKWGAVHVASGTFNMYDGIITGNTLNSGAVSQVTAASTGTFNHEGGVVSAFYHEHNCGHDHSVSGEWKPLSSAMLSSGTTLQMVGGTNYYLDGDYAPAATIVTAAGSTGTINLCLNGYTLSGANSPQLYLIRTNSSVTLNICDCSEGQTGKITGLNNTSTATTSSAVIVARSSDVVNLYAGTITGNTAATVVCAVSTFNMYGGKITGNTGNASILYTNGSASKINISDGSVTDNTVNHASNGAVWIKAGTVAMTGGEIARNQVSGKQVTGATAGFTNNGGTVTEYVAPVPTHTHTCTNGHEVTGEWLPLSDVLDGMTAAKAIPAGNYFLDKDLTIPAKFLQVPGTVNLCLNGHKLKGCTSQGYMFQINGGTLNICDCVGGGTIGEGWDGLSSTTTNSGYAAIRVNGSSTLNLYAGSITGVKDTHGIVYLDANATFNMYGGSITDNFSLWFAPVRMAAASAKFNMTGGTISGNTCTKEPHAQIGSPNGLGNININGGTVVDTHNHSCGHGHNSFGTEWKPLSYFVKTSGNTVLTSGNYYLDRDITLSSGYIAIDGGADVKLCLNGFNLNGVEENSYIFFMGSTSGSNNNTLSICDCTDTGTLGDGWISADGATASTNIRHLAVVRVGGANVSGNTLNLYGGTITNVTAGSAVFVNGGNTLNIYDAKIINNTIKGTGGAAVYNRGQANLYGGEISNNTHEVSAQTSSRGAVATDQATAVTYISGTKVSTPHENQAVVSVASGATVTIVGGKFSKEPKAEFVADGYVLAETGDETYGYTVVPQLITGATVENGEALDLKVTVDVSTLEDELSTYTVSMTKGGVETTGTLDELLTYDEVTLTHHLTFPDVAAKEMGDSIAVTVTDTDGEVVTAHSFTVAEQFKNILASTDDQAVINLCVDALNYGAAAQQRFEHNTDALVNADVTATSTTVTGQWADNLSITEGCEALYAATASLKEKLELNMYFDVDCANGVPTVTVNGAVSHVVSTVTNGTKQILKVALKEIAPKDAKNPISVTVEADEGTIEVTDSLAGYIVRNASERDQAVLAALKRYIDSAIALANQAG